MRIKTLELINNPKIKNLKLDFTVNNEIQDTIIFAGNNGCGKTTILDEIYLLTNHKYYTKCQRTKGKIKSIIVLTDKEIEIVKQNILSSSKPSAKEIECVELLSKTHELEYNINFSNDPSSIEQFEIYALFNDQRVQIHSYSLLVTGKFEQVLSSFYSTANINYNFANITNISTNDLDDDKNNIKTTNDIGTNVKQTFVDIYNLDAQDFQRWAADNIGKPVDESKMYSRIKRFSSAFNYMFSNLKFARIENVQGHKDVIFKNNINEEFTIDNLSTGEKQIVIRGGYMLKYQKSIKNNLILIDEPELSLHPEWQKKILQFYQKLFVDEEGNQTAQIFVATHSPFIIHNLARCNDKVIVLNKDENDKISVLKKPEYYSSNTFENVENAFHIKEFTNKKNVLFTEGETDRDYLNKTIEIYFNNQVNFEVKWIGSYNANGSAINTGCSALDKLSMVIETHPELFSKKIGLLYDCDTNKKNSIKEKYFVYKLNQLPDKNYKIGIENQLNLPHDFQYDKFISSKTRVDQYNIKNINKELNKRKLCDEICSNENNKVFLEPLKNVVKELIELFK